MPAPSAVRTDPYFQDLIHRMEQALQALGLVNTAVGTGLEGIPLVSPPGHRDHDNEQSVPLAANGVFVGEWHEFSHMHNTLVVWLADVAPSGVFIDWSPDGVNPGTGVFDTQRFSVKQIAGYWAGFSAFTVAIQPFMRVRVINGPAAQRFVASFVACTKGPFTGTYAGLEEPISLFSLAGLQRAVLAAKRPDGTFVNVGATADGQLLTTPIDPALLAGLAKEATLTAVAGYLDSVEAKLQALIDKRLAAALDFVTLVPQSFSKVLLVGTGLPQTVKAGPGVLHSIITTGGPTVLAYDDPGTGILNPFLNLALSAATPVVGPLDLAFTTGLRLTVQATKLVTVVYL